MFVTKRKLDQFIVESLKELVESQFETLKSDSDNIQKLEQQKGAILALMLLRDKVGIHKKHWI